MSNNNRVRPLPFKLLRNGSHFRIFAEPSRRLSPADVADKTVYRKHSQAYSSTLDGKKDIVLALDDIVIPLTSGNRPNTGRKKPPQQPKVDPRKGAIALPNKRK